MNRRSAVLDTLLLAIFTLILIAPLFRLEYLDNWRSIESTFIGDARMLSENLPHPGWQPLWYCGTRTDYIYPPALRYGTVLIARIAHVVPARAYHLYTAFLYVFGIIAVYWLVRTGCGARAPALIGAAATALLSPCFLLMKSLRADSPFHVPERLHVLIAYGEGPHISALAILPAALAATVAALRGRRRSMLALAAVLCALVVANNFYGATALAIFYPILVWAVWVTGENRAAAWRPVLLRAIAIPALAWGLSAFWLTPSYVKITLLNLKWVSAPANLLGQSIFLAALAAFAIVSLRTGKGHPDRFWPIFLSGSLIAVSVYVLGWYYFGWVVSGDANRLAPELDLILILAVVESGRCLWNKPGLRLVLAAAGFLALASAIFYLRHAWSPFQKSAPIESVYQFKIASWVHEHLPDERVLPTGTVRFWFDAWYDNAQLDGGSIQGLLNQTFPIAIWQLLHGDRGDLALLWLKAMGTNAVVVPARNSLEPYPDYEHPEKFASMRSIFDDHQGTVIYAVPGARTGIAKVVDTAAMRITPSIRDGADVDGLTKYVAILEGSPHTASLRWRGFDEALVHAEVGPGESVLVQETWDPAWRAYEKGTPVVVRSEERMGFMLLDLTPGSHDIEIRFETPLENRLGEILFVVSLLFTGVLAFDFFGSKRSHV